MADVKAKEQVVSKVRLDYSEYQKLEKKFSRLTFTKETTQLEAAYQCGVQAVLQALREGFTYDQPNPPAG